jgi:hypothetical protein
MGDYNKLKTEIDPLVLQQPEFYFRPAGDKINTLKKYTDLVKEQDRTREAILLLKRSSNGDVDSFQ